MRVCFLFYQAFDEIAKVMIGSVRKHMPNAIVTQLTDLKTRKVEGVDEIRRIDGLTHGYLQSKHMMTCPLPFIRLDYDMIIQGDLTHILEGDHELAFNLHGDKKVLESEYGKKYPIAASVYAAKTHQFAVELRQAQVSGRTDDWLGAAEAHNAVARHFNVKLLDGSKYNYTPNDPSDRPEDALVLHYKGRRKHWMVADHFAQRARVDEDKVVKKVMEYKNHKALDYGPET